MLANGCVDNFKELGSVINYLEAVDLANKTLFFSIIGNHVIYAISKDIFIAKYRTYKSLYEKKLEDKKNNINDISIIREYKAEFGELIEYGDSNQQMFRLNYLNDLKEPNIFDIHIKIYSNGDLECTYRYVKKDNILVNRYYPKCDLSKYSFFENIDNKIDENKG